FLVGGDKSLEVLRLFLGVAFGGGDDQVGRERQAELFGHVADREDLLELAAGDHLGRDGGEHQRRVDLALFKRTAKKGWRTFLQLSFVEKFYAVFLARGRIDEDPVGARMRED